MASDRFESTAGEPSIAFERAGQGTPILFLHGVGGNRSAWSGQLDEFSRSHCAIAIDIRGYGDSDDYEGALRFEDVVADCERVLDAVGAERCHFVGLSMGGLIGQVFICTRPQRLLSATLADTGTGAAEGRGAQWVEAFLASRRKPLVEEGKQPADIAPALAPTLLSAQASPALVAGAAEAIARLRTDSYLKALEAVPRFASAPQLATAAVAVLLPVGAEDRLTPPKAARRLAQRFARVQAEVIELAGAGHLSNIERPQAFNAALRAFIERNESRER
ncbi:MAG: alpha/beta fold hydrolase [Burkholderiales bacterium]|nr:MAG: alpha/beta fold hydrolase [Burkholderiales bacterium]